METFINILIVTAMAAVVASLVLGLVSLARGGPEARSSSNRFMRWRVASQAVAVLLITVGLIWKSAH